MAVTTISAEEYDEKIAFLTDVIADGREEGDDLHRAVRETLDADEWFFQRRFGPAAHGCILEHADADPEEWVDTDAYTEGKTPTEAVKTLAFLAMEYDLIDRLQ